MWKYLIIQLCNSSVSICNYEKSERKALISLADLEKGLIWAIKEGANIQVIYPLYRIPNDYECLLNSYEHIKIQPYYNEGNEDSAIIVLDGWSSLKRIKDRIDVPVLLHTNVADFITNRYTLSDSLANFVRLNIIFTDVHTFKDNQKDIYAAALHTISEKIEKQYLQNNNIQLNLLTDRLMLVQMNNCNAGVESLTLAPDGKFYICPAFYLGGFSSVGTFSDINIRNQHLYNINYAPICRNCDAYHCRRCVWLNKQTTLEVNTPSHQQCLMAHIERQVSKNLLERLRKHGEYSPAIEISNIDYFDPIDKLIKH